MDVFDGRRLAPELFRFAAPARPIHTVFLHCSASDRPEHDSVEVFDAWHRARGFNGIGYHFVINKAGTFQVGRALSLIPSAQSGHNKGSVAICLHGLREDLFTSAQFATLIAMATVIRNTYARVGQAIRFRGHCEVSAKACPVFDYRRVLGLDPRGYMAGAPDAITVDAPASIPQAPTVARTLRLFDRGEDVRALQSRLAARGFAAGAADGIFGHVTRAAVVAAQSAAGLSPDGVVGPVTRVALGL